MKIILPFPPRDLSPNARKHWRGLASIRKSYHEQCFARASGKNALETDRTYAITIKFYPPANRGDLDNMLAATKHGLDGMAKALGIDDKQFRPITIDIVSKSKENPRAEVTIIE